MSASLHRPLPTCPRTAGESLPAYGRRVLCFLLATSCTATLSDEALEAATHAARVAVTARDISAQGLERISQCSHVVAAVRAARKRDRIEAEQLANARAALHAGRFYKDGIATDPSAAVPLVPRPKPQPPAADALKFPEAAEVQF